MEGAAAVHSRLERNARVGCANPGRLDLAAMGLAGSGPLVAARCFEGLGHYVDERPHARNLPPAGRLDEADLTARRAAPNRSTRTVLEVKAISPTAGDFQMMFVTAAVSG